MNSLEPTVSLHSKTIPRYFYGTAWKEDRTEELTLLALQQGFRAIDTANQRKHYFEAGVGAAVKKFLASGVKREQLFLQTKFTYARGQDHRKPYDENDSFTKQVADSFSSSLEHLGTSYIDSYVLHGPYSHHRIGQEDLEVWSAMEKLVEKNQVTFLGASNVTVGQLGQLYDAAKIKPSFVQNRCYARFGWDREVREFCQSKGIFYQGFSLLTANQAELMDPRVAELAKKHGKTIAQVIFRFCLEKNMIVITGTSNASHMKTDLDIYGFSLTEEEVSFLEMISL